MGGGTIWRRGTMDGFARVADVDCRAAVLYGAPGTIRGCASDMVNRYVSATDARMRESAELTTNINIIFLIHDAN